MFSSRKTFVAVAIVFALLLGGCTFAKFETDPEMLATGILDDSTTRDLLEKPELTVEEYKAILQKIEEALRLDPHDLFANLLKTELAKKPIR